MKDIKIRHKNQQLVLHPYRAMYWVDEKMLVISDVHFGKAGHFRKSGIPIPGSIHKDDIERITFLNQYYNPDEVLFLGDLFHSSFNKEYDALKLLLAELKADITLVSGNHDVLDPGYYDFINYRAAVVKRGPFVFHHHPPEENIGENYVISGHIHPAISIKSGIRQRTKLSCFYFGKTYALLPAFGKFTGNYKISYNFNDNIYAVTDDEIMKISSSGLSEQV